MKEIQVALINWRNYCLFPAGVTSIEEFIAFMNKNYHSFVELEFLLQEGCVGPFFIDEELETKKEYWNPLSIPYIREETAYLLNRTEYEERLKKVIAEKCVHCMHYSEEYCLTDHRSHIESIDLNGECMGFESKE